MMAGFSAPMRRLVLVSICILLLDQLTKWLIVRHLPLYANITVIDNFFNITHVLNPGGAFGFFAEQSPGIRKFIFLFLSSGVALFVLWLYRKTAQSHTFLSYGLP
jgi:Lipoprotein signal peptidase